MAQPTSATWIGPEEHAYNTYSGAHSGSNRRGRVRFPDGKIRTVTLGVPDTYFSIPAHGRVNGKYVSGVVMHESEWGEDGEYKFYPTGKYQQDN